MSLLATARWCVPDSSRPLFRRQASLSETKREDREGIFRPKRIVRPLNLFYEEPEDDRWFLLDRYPRRLVRRLLRGKSRPGGQMRLFLNLRAGLERIGVPYRVNDYGYARRHPHEVACIVGKPHVLDKTEWVNPILFGAAVHSHPSDAPDLLTKYPIRKILVPGDWMRQMCEPAWGDQVNAWPVGIDTCKWVHSSPEEKDIDVLLYDKVRWEHERFEDELIAPVVSHLERRRKSYIKLRYGFYREEEFHDLLARSRMMIFLCEHETQGIAYQQALSCGVPILAWDRSGYWRDPFYYPHKVKFAPVTSVPYWDERCGMKFRDAEDFSAQFDRFQEAVESRVFAPRDYILENLTLEKCAERYVEIVRELQ